MADEEQLMDQPITVSENMLGSLKDTTPWVKFLASVCFVVTAFMALAGIITFVGFTFGPTSSRLEHIFGPITGVLEIAAAGFFYLIPGILMLRYGNALTRIPAAGLEAMEDALRQQKSLWKYVGIFTIALLVFYVLLIIAMIVFAVIYGSIAHP